MVPSLRRVLVVVLIGSSLACGNSDQRGEEPISYGPISSSTPDNPTSDADLPAAPFCESLTTNDPARMRFEALNPIPRAAYIALRSTPGAGSDERPTNIVTVAERGQLCGDASDIAQCKAAYDALRPRGVPSGITFTGHVHCFTRGDAVGCIETIEDGIAFLGPVKSLDEAFWLAELAGYHAQCTAPEIVARGTKLGDGSYQISTMTQRKRCEPILRAVINVKPNGELREIDVRKTDVFTGCDTGG